MLPLPTPQECVKQPCKCESLAPRSRNGSLSEQRAVSLVSCSLEAADPQLNSGSGQQETVGTITHVSNLQPADGNTYFRVHWNPKAAQNTHFIVQ